MKKMFEGASLITAIFMVLSVAGFFIFSVQNKTNKSKERKRSEKALQEAKVDYDRRIQQKEKEMQDLKKEYDIFFEEIRPLYYENY